MKDCSVSLQDVPTQGQEYQIEEVVISIEHDVNWRSAVPVSISERLELNSDASKKFPEYPGGE